MTEKRKKLKTKGISLHMDNVGPHLVNKRLEELGIKRLPHPPYSPDLAPSDFFLFGHLKKFLREIILKQKINYLKKWR